MSMHFEGEAHVPLLFLSMQAKPKRGENGYVCDSCHAFVREGDWPWCHGKQENHERA